MSRINDGGPAFPVVGSDQCKDYPGMSLRDYFAAKAMQALITAMVSSNESAAAVNEDAQRLGLGSTDWVARRAYQAADAMLAAREANS